MSASWKEAELEHVLRCPVCGTGRFRTIHQDLEDRVFFVADGRWQLQRCDDCRCTFLDPRPTRETIQRAYATYYTHSPARPRSTATADLSAFRRLRRGISNGYINMRFGANRPDAFRWGYIAAMLFPRQRALLDAEFRHVPKRPHDKARLLDIGCGNGDFLATANDIGWSAVGIDFDAEAVRHAQARGCDARLASVDALAFDDASFDAITMSHVIEHVHDPIGLLRRAFELLRPAGALYLETPNIDGAGAISWGRNWRGLEPPRHLVLFNHRALEQALRATGFDGAKFFHRGHVTAGIWRQSMNIAEGRPPLDPSARLPRLGLLWAQIAAALDPRRSEFVTLVARKRHD